MRSSLFGTRPGLFSDLNDWIMGSKHKKFAPGNYFYMNSDQVVWYSRKRSEFGAFYMVAGYLTISEKYGQSLKEFV